MRCITGEASGSFYDHRIRDQNDLNWHLDYIHYNPVKHGLVDCPHAYPYSTFNKWVGREAYEKNWCCECDGVAAQPPDFSWADGIGME